MRVRGPTGSLATRSSSYPLPSPPATPLKRGPSRRAFRPSSLRRAVADRPGLISSYWATPSAHWQKEHHEEHRGPVKEPGNPGHGLEGRRSDGCRHAGRLVGCAHKVKRGYERRRGGLRAAAKVTHVSNRGVTNSEDASPQTSLVGACREMRSSLLSGFVAAIYRMMVRPEPVDNALSTIVPPADLGACEGGAYSSGMQGWTTASFLNQVDGGLARTRLPEPGHHRLAEIAEERWPPGERARRLEHRVQRPLDLGCAEVGAQSLPNECDEARRAEKLAPIVATEKKADLGPDNVLGREAHRDFFVTSPWGTCGAFFSGVRLGHCPGGGHELNLPRPGVYERNAVEP